jgi:hypothetical protein
MGKDSLLKSTAADTDKKTTAKKKPAAAKKATTAKKKPAAKKPAAKKTTTKKSTATKKATAKTAAKKAVSKPAAKSKASVKAKAATTQKTKAETKLATKKETKPTVRAAVNSTLKPKTETKPASKVEIKPAPKAEATQPPPVKKEVKPEPKPETKSEAKVEPKAEPKPEPVKTTAAKVQPKPAPAAAKTTPPPIPAPKPTTPPVDELPPAPPGDSDSPDPVAKMLKYAGLAFVALILLVIGASWVNTGYYYLKPVGKDLQIYQGSFSPLGKNLLVTLPGVAAPKQIEDVYSAQEALVFAFQYYLKKADTLIDVQKTPDFDAIKTVLNQALQYAATDKMRTLAQKRLSFIDVMLLVYKSDAAAGKNTIEGVSAALSHLEKATKIVVDSGQKELVAKRVKSLEKLKADLIARQKLRPAPKKPAADKTIKKEKIPPVKHK